jgi:hypothetical protein
MRTHAQLKQANLSKLQVTHFKTQDFIRFAVTVPQRHSTMFIMAHSIMLDKI